MVASFLQPTHVGLIKRSTTHFEFQIPYFDTPGWGLPVERNFDALDALLYASVGFTGVTGVWENDTAYSVGDRVIDEVNGFIYQCNVAHTSAASDLFSDDRTANPTYWTLFNNQWNFRGAWVTATEYVVGDMVYDTTEYVVAVCITDHTAGANIRSVDGAKWQFIADLKSSVQAAATSASNASTSETNAAASAAAALTSENNAETAETNAETAEANAATHETNAETAASNAAASEANAADSETNAATSAGNAENSFLSLDKRYLGAKVGDPALDNQGEPLLDGALYFNSTTLVFRAYDEFTDTWYDAPAINVDALDVTFDPTGTGLSSTNLQDAMAELAAQGVADADYGDVAVAAGVWTVQASALTSMGITSSVAELNLLDGVTASTTELNYVDGVTSAIQTQLDGKQPLDSDLTTIAGLTATTDNFIVSVASAWASRTPAQVRTTLGLVIGTNVQAYDALLASIAGLTVAAGGFIRTSAADTAVAQAMVGTVSQSSGTPTGAIVEKGSNANGEYVRFADGTQICWSPTFTMAPAGVTAWGATSPAASWTFPAAFSANPVCIPSPITITVVATGNRNMGVWAPSAISTTAMTPRYLGSGEWTVDASTWTHQFVAIGRWF